MKVGSDLEAAGQAGLEHLRLLLRHAPHYAQRPSRHLAAHTGPLSFMLIFAGLFCAVALQHAVEASVVVHGCTGRMERKISCSEECRV